MSKKKCLKVPSRGFSMYSSGSEDAVGMTHKGLDRCASLLAHIMENPSSDGDRTCQGRDKHHEPTGLKTKSKKKVKKKSSAKGDKSRVKVPPRVDKNAQTLRAERKTQQGHKKSKLGHQKVVFQPGMVSSTPQRAVHKEKNLMPGLDTVQTAQAQTIQGSNNQVRGHISNSSSKFVGQSGRFGSTGHYGDQMIPERDTGKGNRHFEKDARGHNEFNKTENFKRVVNQEGTDYVKQRYDGPSSSDKQFSMDQSGNKGYMVGYVPSEVESVTSNEIASLLNDPRSNIQNGLQWVKSRISGIREPLPESHAENFSSPTMLRRTEKETGQCGILSSGEGPRPHTDGTPNAFFQTSLAPADENRVARNVLRDLVNTLKTINERESASFKVNPKVGNETDTAASTPYDEEIKPREVNKYDDKTLRMEEKTDDALRHEREKEQMPPVYVADQNSKVLRSEACDKLPEDFLGSVQDSHHKEERELTSVRKYSVGWDREWDDYVHGDYGLEKNLKRDVGSQERKNKETMRNGEISPEIRFSRKRLDQTENEIKPGENDEARSPENRKKKRKFQSASAGTKSRTKRALWEQQRVLKCLLMELKAITNQKENLEVQRLYGEILQTLETLPYLTMDCDVQTEIAMGLQPLRSENAQLRRKLRISNQQMKEMQKTEQQQQSFEVIALKTLNATLQGQLETEQKDTAVLKEKVEVLSKEVEALVRDREELTKLLQLKDESHLRSQREWITEMATLRKQQTCSKQELEATKLSLDSARRESALLLKSLEESKEMLRNCKETRTKVSPGRKRTCEFGELENMSKVTKEPVKNNRLDAEEANLQNASLLTDSKSFERSRIYDISVVDEGQDDLRSSSSRRLQRTTKGRSSSTPLGLSQSSAAYQNVPDFYPSLPQDNPNSYGDAPGSSKGDTYQYVSAPYHNATSLYQNAASSYRSTTSRYPGSDSKPIDQVSSVSESTASSITSLFEAQFQLGLHNLDDKIAKLQQNLKCFKANKNS